jgi:hypothetical protein
MVPLDELGAHHLPAHAQALPEAIGRLLCFGVPAAGRPVAPRGLEVDRAHLVEPHRLAQRDGGVDEPVVLCAAVPVVLARRRQDHVAAVDALGRFATDADPADTVGHLQELPVLVPVPVRA